MFGANFVILAHIYDELSRWQAEFPRILSHNGQNDLEGQGLWPLFSIPTENIPWCMFGANLVIPVQVCDELSCGQGKVYGRTDGRTDRRTYAGNDNTLRPEMPRGKKQIQPSNPLKILESRPFILDDHCDCALFWCARSGPWDWTLRDWSETWHILTWLVKWVSVAFEIKIFITP